MNAEKILADRLSTVYPPGESKAIARLVLGKINPGDKEKFDEIINRLLNHEPVQYILNESWFCNLPFYVDKNVLIPRQETEELVEWIISDVQFPIDTLSILDVGTGSGCIAIALKRRMRKAEVWACEVSGAALKIATRNSEALGTPVHFVKLDFLDAIQRNQLPSFDIIVSNPPYIPLDEKSFLAANVRDFEPHDALFVPDNNATLFYEALADFGMSHLKKGGKIYAEIHENYSSQVISAFKNFNPYLKKDMQGKSRMIRAII